MKSSRAIFGVVLVFVLGILCGILATHLMYKYRIESILSGRAQTRHARTRGTIRIFMRRL